MYKLYNVHKVIISIIGGCTNVQKVKIFTKWEELKVVQFVQMYKKKNIYKVGGVRVVQFVLIYKK